MTIGNAISGFFSCFRLKRDRHGPRNATRTRGVSRSRNRLSSLFLSEEVEESSLKTSAQFLRESSQSGNERNDEAKFLKTPGTIPKTSDEKASVKFKGDELDSKPSMFNAVEKLQVDENPDQILLVKLQENWGMDTRSRDLPSSSCLTSEQISGRISNGSMDSVHGKTPDTAVKVQANQVKENPTMVLPLNSAENIRCKNNSVRFMRKADTTSPTSSLSENICLDLQTCKSPGTQREFKALPYPTPLKLDDAMQTPGTVYPANLENIGNKRTRIRSNYAYSVSNIVESASPLKPLEGDDPDSHHLVAEPIQSEHAILQPDKVSDIMLMTDDFLVDRSLTAQQNSAPFIDHGYNQSDEPVPTRKPSFVKSHSDRPIIGIVATHWNEDNISPVTPKWWDGNGIPNSTNKYKEDQKVSWHATPFEERLEKALSMESSLSERNRGKTIVLADNEENDTAMSKQQISPRSNLAVSC